MYLGSPERQAFPYWLTSTTLPRLSDLNLKSLNESCGHQSSTVTGTRPDAVQSEKKGGDLSYHTIKQRRKKIDGANLGTEYGRFQENACFNRRASRKKRSCSVDHIHCVVCCVTTTGPLSSSAQVH